MSETSAPRPKTSGPGRVLIVFYFIMTIAALFRSIYQIAVQFSVAPAAYLLTLLAGVVYLVATIALVRPGRTAYRVAFGAITVELVGVVTVGFVSVLSAGLFPPFGARSTAWGFFGIGYLFLPLALPVLGLLFLRGQRATFAKAA